MNALDAPEKEMYGLRAVVEVRGFEPLASSVRGKRSAGLSYTPGLLNLSLEYQVAFRA